MRERPRVLVVEDGHEYSTLLSRHLAGAIEVVRAGDAAEALACIAAQSPHAVFLDMRFDRIPAEGLLGDVPALAERFGGDRARAVAFLAENQGTYVLEALRAAGYRRPVVMSYDFGSEPRRWRHLESRYAPLAWLGDNAGPERIRAVLLEAAGG